MYLELRRAYFWNFQMEKKAFVAKGYWLVKGSIGNSRTVSLVVRPTRVLDGNHLFA